MPVKRRTDKSRRWRITPEAAARWREVRTTTPDPLDDEVLCSLVGWPFLIAMPPADIAELLAALEEAI